MEQSFDSLTKKLLALTSSSIEFADDGRSMINDVSLDSRCRSIRVITAV